MADKIRDKMKERYDEWFGTSKAGEIAGAGLTVYAGIKIIDMLFDDEEHLH